MKVYKYISLILTVLFFYTGNVEALDDERNVLNAYDSKSLINLIIGISPDPEYWQYLRQYDTDGNGYLDSREWNNFYRDVQSEDQGDPGMGFLCTSEEELTDWLDSQPGVNRNTAANMALQIMQQYDVDQDGKLSVSELNNFVKKNSPKKHQISPPEPFPE